MAKKKPYYPNNWKKIKNVPAEYFDSLSFEEFMDWRGDNWEIPSSVACIIREENSVTGLITEYTYSKPSAARKRVNQIMDAGHDFTIANAAEVIDMKPLLEIKDDDTE
tara:strand:+ start:153 stop:476 length:324 start_codon:yes stop_codon:yes gene_type:complete